MPDSAANGGRAGIGKDAARAWIDRWDVQQMGYMPDREDRFTAMIDALEEFAGRPDPLVLDLGCGPGSLAVRLLGRLPKATVIAVDADPVLLTLGRAAFADLPGLRFADVDLRADSLARALAQSLGLDRQPDAAVSTTALHWLPRLALEGLYRQLAGLLRPGGLFLNGDHMRVDAQRDPVLDRLGRALIEREEQRQLSAGRAETETWADWWNAVTADPYLA